MIYDENGASNLKTDLINIDDDKIYIKSKVDPSKKLKNTTIHDFFKVKEDSEKEYLSKKRLKIDYDNNNKTDYRQLNERPVELKKINQSENIK